MRALAALMGLSLVVSACGGDDDAPKEPDEGLLGDGDHRVRFGGDGLSVERRGEPVLVIPAAGFVLGRVEQLSNDANYDPYPMAAKDPTAKEPEGLEWLAGERLVLRDSGASSASLTIEHAGGARSTLTLSADAEGRFGARFLPEDPSRVAYLRVRPSVAADEGFYGLGEYFDAVDHRGKLRAMQIEISNKLESGYNEAHVPVPFVLGTRGWGLFVESPYPAAFDVAAAQPEALEITFGTGLGSDQGLAFHLFSADHPLDVTARYYDVTGKPRVPARWALGPLVWRDENIDQAQFENDLNQMRDLDLATTGVWIDRPYATGVNTFDFKAEQFPDPAQMIDLAHSLGFRMALWHTPYLDEKDASTQALRDEALSNGYYPPKYGITLNKWGPAIDLTNEAAFAWWQRLIEKYTSAGIEGFKLDYGEDVVPGVFGVRNEWHFSDGSDERTMHSLFQLFYHRVYAELLPNGSFLLCRGGTYGDQKNVDVIWPGDLDASFAKQGDVVQSGTEKYNSVGGLPASIIAGLTLGPSGFPFYGADTGGYRHSPPDKELFTRWFQQTALSTVMQIGTSTNDVAWEPTAKNGFDEEMLGWYREYTRLHLRLWPYAWTYAQRLAIDGRPIQRALGLAYPELGIHPDDLYLFGDHLFVAPVVARGQIQKELFFPPGTWVSWWTGEVHAGATHATVDAPLSRLPLFLRAGGIVPMLRPTIDAIAPTTDPARVDSYATTPGLLTVRIAVGEPSSFELFDGAELGQAATDTGFELTHRSGAEFTQGAVFEVLAVSSKPASVMDGGEALAELSAAELDSAASGWAFEPASLGGLLIVKITGGDHTITVTR
jgi:alpha-D-xyloside xylohydrolase